MTDYDEIIRQLNALGTEQVNPDTIDIDRLSPLEIASKINTEDQKVAGIVKLAMPIIASAASQFAETIKGGGRVFYVGAGTSGRLGVLDAAECPPTFGSDPDQIVGLISGGYETLVLSREGVEDDCDTARNDLQTKDLTKDDFVIGIAASNRTPYTLAALEYANEIGCRTALIVCNKVTQDSDLPLQPDFLIELPVGPEAITGSTRMKSGTAQKMTLNMISTTAMVLLGKTYGNLMVDLQARSEKLRARSRKILIDLFDLTLEDADRLLTDAGGSVKTAVVMHKLEISRSEAEKKLIETEGFVSRTLS